MKYNLNLQYTENRDKKFLKGVFGEFLATLLFLFISITTVSYNVFHDESLPGQTLPQTRMSIAYTFGFSIMALVYIFASVSGANVNPAVSFSLMMSNRLSVPRTLFYIGAQCGGAIVGTGLAKYIGGDHYDALGNGAINSVADGVTNGEAFIGELIMTYLLCTTVLVATDEKVTKKFNHNSALLPFAIGIAVFLSHQVLIPITNCSVNPARSLGTNVVAGEWSNAWIWWLAPLSGGGLASIIWGLLSEDNSSSRSLERTDNTIIQEPVSIA
jgi:aquaporin PIP